MLYFFEQSGKLYHTSKMRDVPSELRVGGYFTKWDIQSCDHAHEIAKRLSSDEETFIAVDMGESARPRWDIIKLPQVGDFVECKTENGTILDCGEVELIDECFTITTSTGREFVYVGSATWINHNNTLIYPIN